MTETEDNSADQTDTTEDHGIVGMEKAVLKIADEYIYMRTLVRNPFPKLVTLNTWVVEVWGKAQEVLGGCRAVRKVKGTGKDQHIRLFELHRN